MELVIATGGTGGHVYPALAVGQTARAAGMEVSFVVGGLLLREGFEGFPVTRIAAGGLVRKSLPGKLRGLVRLAAGLVRSLLLLSGRRCALLATGSYASAPVLLAARLLRKSYFLLEQNAVPGRTVRFFSKGAKAVFGTFEEGRARLPGAPYYVTGNPLREGLSVRDRGRSRRALGLPPEGDVVLVLGGSHGARELSMAALDLAKQWEDGPFFHVIAGRREYDRTVERHGRTGSRFLISDFLDDVSLALSAADIAVSRAGGGGIAELALFGLPAVLVPFPFAADDHQRANAEAASAEGGCVVLPRERLGELRGLLTDILSDKERRRLMQRAQRMQAKPDAANEVIKHIRRLL